jgi:hypothetical protein
MFDAHRWPPLCMVASTMAWNCSEDADKTSFIRAGAGPACRSEMSMGLLTNWRTGKAI